MIHIQYVANNFKKLYFSEEYMKKAWVFDKHHISVAIELPSLHPIR